MIICVTGLVLKEYDTGESDKRLTVLTLKYGKISVLAKGVKNLKNKNFGAAQKFVYAEFVLYEKNGFYWLSEASIIKRLFDDRIAFADMVLLQYIIEVTDCVCPNNSPEDETLKLCVNTAYAICDGKRNNTLVKAAFELRLTAQIGFLPQLLNCDVCGITGKNVYGFDIANGCLICASCAEKKAAAEPYVSDAPVPLNTSVLAAMLFILSTETKRVFSFELSEDDMKILASVSEKYMLYHLEQSFKALELYKSLI